MSKRRHDMASQNLRVASDSGRLKIIDARVGFDPFFRVVLDRLFGKRKAKAAFPKLVDPFGERFFGGSFARANRLPMTLAHVIAIVDDRFAASHPNASHRQPAFLTVLAVRAASARCCRTSRISNRT